jgi:hypothetical protein
MSDDGELVFKIGIIGPTRVGKTSLIASILKDGQRLLEGTLLNISPRGTATERRIAQHHKELEGSLRAGEFNSGAVQGTEEQFTFELQIDTGVASAGIHMDVLDYPGGWLDAARRPPEREADWKACKRWMTESTVLLVPIESAALMEAATAKHKKATPHILTTWEVGQVAREWAKERASRPNEPALLLLCPVKCESYFADNGGQRDSSLDLYKAVLDMYGDILQAVRSEASSNVKIVYSPVDTIGCVEIVRALWKAEASAPGGYEFTADYRVRQRGAVKGADAVLVSLCKHLVDAKQRAVAAAAEEMGSDASEARRVAEKDEGFLDNIWLWMSGRRKRLRQVANTKKDQAERQRRCVEALDQMIERLAGRDFGPRVREI